MRWTLAVGVPRALMDHRPHAATRSWSRSTGPGKVTTTASTMPPVPEPDTPWADLVASIAGVGECGALRRRGRHIGGEAPDQPGRGCAGHSRGHFITGRQVANDALDVGRVDGDAMGRRRFRGRGRRWRCGRMSAGGQHGHQQGPATGPIRNGRIRRSYHETPPNRRHRPDQPTASITCRATRWICSAMSRRNIRSRSRGTSMTVVMTPTSSRCQTAP